MNIAPALRYPDAPGAIDFLVRAFGFNVLARYDGEAGTVAHAQLGIDGGAIMLSTRGPETETNPWSRVDQGLYVQVEDPDAHHARAVAAGAIVVMPLRDTEYGSREYSAQDTEGNFWAFGTYPTGATGTRTSLYPWICYANANSAFRFLQDAFGFRCGLEVRSESGRLEHAELWLGSGVLMIGEGEGHFGQRAGMSVAVADPDVHHTRAADAGARILQAPHDTPYGARSYTAADPGGFVWTPSTYHPA